MGKTFCGKSVAKNTEINKTSHVWFLNMVTLFILITKQSPIILLSAPKQRENAKSEWSLVGQNDAT